MNVLEINVNPDDIQKMSYIAGCATTRRRRMEELKLTYKNRYLDGNWDLTERLFKNSLTFKDYELFKAGEKNVYNWEPLYKSIKKNGYVQNPNKRYVEVAIGRTGEILMVDGRHRLFLAQEFGIKTIPVNVIYIHPEYNFDKMDLIKSPVIPEFLYNLISQKWDKEIKVYHHWGTINHRYNLVKKYLPLLKDLNVLEIGCNSGMMMWSIMKYAKTLTEFEKQAKYFNQCKITKAQLREDNVFIYNQSFRDFDNKKDINALYASFVLYHMNDDEIELLKRTLSKCNVVIIPNRQKERRSQINSYYLNRDIEIKKLLESCGFNVIIDTTFERGYSVIVGTKDKENDNRFYKEK